MNELLRTDIRDRLFVNFRDLYQCYFLRRKRAVDGIKHAFTETSRAMGYLLEILDNLQDVVLTFAQSYDDVDYLQDVGMTSNFSYMNYELDYAQDDSYDHEPLNWDGYIAYLEKAIRLLNESKQSAAFYSLYVSDVDDRGRSGSLRVKSQRGNCTLPRHVFAWVDTRSCVHMLGMQASNLDSAEHILKDMKLVSDFLHDHTDSINNTNTMNIMLPNTRFLEVEYTDNNTALRVQFPTEYQLRLSKMEPYLDCLTSYESLLGDISNFLEMFNRPINLGINYEVDHLLEDVASVRSWLEGQIIRYARNETTKELLAKEFSIHIGDFMATSEAISKETQQFIIAPLQALIREEQTEVGNLYVKGIEMFRELVDHIDSAELRRRPRNMTIWKGPLPVPGSSQVHI